MTNTIADAVRAAAEQLHQAAREAALCAPGPNRHVLLTPEQCHAIANAWEHQADDMDDHGAVEQTEGIVNGPAVKDEDGSYRFDWGATLGAARSYRAEA